jgi:small subunit ribosomal protein S16
LATKIRLKRLGKKHVPFYRVVVSDARAKRDGKVIEEIGKYHPTEQPSFIEINAERAQYWLSVGAQPTEAVLALMKLTGDWQNFKGEKYDESILKHKKAKGSVEDALAETFAEAEKIKAAASAKLAEEAEKAAAAEAEANAKAEKEAEPVAEDNAEESSEAPAEAVAESAETTDEASAEPTA